MYDFAEGGRDMADLLGGKGANLAEMARMGLPVPPACRFTAFDTASPAKSRTDDRPS